MDNKRKIDKMIRRVAPVSDNEIQISLNNHDDEDNDNDGLLSSSGPVDSNNLAYAIMFYQGIGNLLPWNAFITAAAYFKGRFCGTSLESKF